MLYPPTEAHKLRDKLGNVVWNVGGDVDEASFPLFREVYMYIHTCVYVSLYAHIYMCDLETLCGMWVKM